ncbi:unnamed protein product [Clonostachys byssicola]|uniref:Uncharacterized protein n=1 Tax=Clonostachys byssicola TaxID=160290 RepID=A0A9N9UPF2_9HYPO|nr:unnamed protein product [Clonostachys byssicola]
MSTSTSNSKPWADQPLALIPTPAFLTKQHNMWISGASHMCNVHNVIFRGYNSIYLQAPHVQEADMGAFLGSFSASGNLVTVFLNRHMKNMVSFFRMLASLLSWLLTKGCQDAFMPLLQAFQKYLDSLENGSQLSSDKILSLMSAFQQPFEIHFRNEIELIASLATHPNAPREGSTEQIEAQKNFDKWGSSSVTRSGITDVLMFFFHNLDNDYEDGLWKDWPDIPGPVRWLMPRVIGGWHRQWWKFASCDVDGKRKELCLPSEEHTGIDKSLCNTR